MNISTYIDEQIKSKLGLFTDFRSQEDDQKLYDEAQTLLLAEVIQFIQQNQGNNLDISKLDDIISCNNISEALSKVTQELVLIPDWEFRLSKRLTFFLNNWMIERMKY
jgi:hypothetical protein